MEFTHTNPRYILIIMRTLTVKINIYVCIYCSPFITALVFAYKTDVGALIVSYAVYTGIDVCTMLSLLVAQLEQSTSPPWLDGRHGTQHGANSLVEHRLQPLLCQR